MVHYTFEEYRSNSYEAQRIYRERYPLRQVPNVRTFIDVHRRLREDGCFRKPKLNSGVSRTRRTVRNEETVLRMVENNPRTSTRKTSSANKPALIMKCDNKTTTIHKDVVIIGNGPSGIALSYMLAGNIPYVTSNDHPDEMLSARLALSVGQSLINEDLEFLSSGLEGRSTNPVSLLLDSLTHPCADIGLEIEPLIEWRKKGTEIDHIVFGKGPPGGSWHTMDPHILTLSLGTWMSLPGYKYTTRDTTDKRAFAHNVARYYEQYVKETGLTKYFANGTIVTNITELEDSRESAEKQQHECFAKIDEQMEVEEISKPLDLKQAGCPITNALNFLLSRGQRRLKIDRCCKRKLAEAECKLKEEKEKNELGKNRFKKMNLNCDRNRSVSFSCDYDSLKRANGSVYSTSFSGEHATFFNFLRNSCSLDSSRLFKKVPEDVLPLTSSDCDPTTSKAQQVAEKPKASANTKPRWLIEVLDIKTKTVTSYTCNSLVLANGASDLPNRLMICNEKKDPNWLLHDVRSLEIELDLYLQQNTGEPDPVLIVGAGLSAADAIIATRGKNVPVLHMFRNKYRDLNKQLPENMYPEYHKFNELRKYCIQNKLPHRALRKYELEEIIKDHLFRQTFISEFNFDDDVIQKPRQRKQGIHNKRKDLDELPQLIEPDEDNQDDINLVMETLDENANSSDPITGQSQQRIYNQKEKRRKARIKFNKFCNSWLKMEEFQKWITKSKNTKKGHELAFCQLCHCDITAHKTDLVRHSKSEKHILNERQVASNEKVKNITFFSEDDSVKRAEIKLAAFLASNNLPFIMMDTLSPLCSNLFPDSKIASKLAIRRTKSTMVVRHCLGEVFQKNLIDILRVPGTFFP
ncbi:hypothetical protein MML48_2g00016134 [Holotrichia oblita]|uniref:Uncharacterized protein n=2 Tax=Holotrichia oblita TaxID=644536 RepID=A0ACB9TKJ4_HOLOL|nr:hypothetical protein MML48_2g00016134 [Holotrichia oblita]